MGRQHWRDRKRAYTRDGFDRVRLTQAQSKPFERGCTLEYSASIQLADDVWVTWQSTSGNAVKRVSGGAGLPKLPWQKPLTLHRRPFSTVERGNLEPSEP